MKHAEFAKLLLLINVATLTDSRELQAATATKGLINLTNDGIFKAFDHANQRGLQETGTVVVEEDHEGEDHSDEEHSDHEGGEIHSDEEEEHDDHEGESSSDGIDIDTFKIVMLFCMILCVGLGIIPKLWGKCSDNEEILSMLNCFSAGIFMAMSLVHMMPEAAEVYQGWALCEKIEKPFPLPYVMYFVGYFFILSIDRVAARAYHAGHEHQSKDPQKSTINPDMIQS